MNSRDKFYTKWYRRIPGLRSTTDFITHSSSVKAFKRLLRDDIHGWIYEYFLHFLVFCRPVRRLSLTDNSTGTWNVCSIQKLVLKPKECSSKACRKILATADLSIFTQHLMPARCSILVIVKIVEPSKKTTLQNLAW